MKGDRITGSHKARAIAPKTIRPVIVGCSIVVNSFSLGIYIISYYGIIVKG